MKALKARWDKMKKRDKYVIAAVLNLCWYCIAVLVLTAHDKVVPDSLTVAWFAAWTAKRRFAAWTTGPRTM